MTLHDTIRDDALTVFCNADDFAEPVVYHPGNGSSRPINAVVIREESGQFGADDESSLPLLSIQVANSVTDGISAEELSEGQDQIELSVRVGDAPTRRTITALISNDEGMLELQCR